MPVKLTSHKHPDLIGDCFICHQPLRNEPRVYEEDGLYFHRECEANRPLQARIWSAIKETTSAAFVGVVTGAALSGIESAIVALAYPWRAAEPITPLLTFPLTAFSAIGVGTFLASRQKKLSHKGAAVMGAAAGAATLAVAAATPGIAAMAGLSDTVEKVRRCAIITGSALYPTSEPFFGNVRPTATRLSVSAVATLVGSVAVAYLL